MKLLSLENAPISRWMHLTVLVMCIFAITAAWTPAASGADLNIAGLVVDYGDGRVSYAVVPFAEEEISGIELLRRSGLDLVTVGFGGMGDAVCQIEDTGCPVDECRRRLCQTSDPESPFWRYSRQTSPGEWEFLALGASGARVGDGDIDGWSWTGTGSSLPPLTMDEIAERAGAEAPLLTTADVLSAVLRTHGGETGEQVPAGAVAGAVTVGIIGLVAGLAVWRSRRHVRSRV
jgi:hypothetical protein